MATQIYRSIPGFRPSTPPVTSATIEDVLAAHPMVVIHFWAEWNGVDPPMDQSIREIQPDFHPSVYFVSCNIDAPENVDLCNRCNVVNIPFLAVFVGGEQRRGVMGLRSPDELFSELEERLSDSHSKKKWWRFWECT